MNRHDPNQDPSLKQAEDLLFSARELLALAEERVALAKERVEAAQQGVQSSKEGMEHWRRALLEAKRLMSASSQLLQLSQEELGRREQKREALEKQVPQAAETDELTLLVIDARALCLEAERIVIVASGAEEEAQDRVNDASDQITRVERRLEFDEGVLGNALELLALAEDRLERAEERVNRASQRVERQAGREAELGPSESGGTRPEG